MSKIKSKKSHPPFEVEEYDYGHLSNRDETGSVFIHVKFSNDNSMHFHFEFHEFIVFHKRKKSEFYRNFVEARQKLSGWGTRYYDLVENSEEFDFDFFTMFKEYLTENEVTLDAYKKHLETLKIFKQREKHVKENPPKISNPTPEELAERTQKNIEWEEYCAEQNEMRNSPYEQDRNRLREIVEDATDDMYEALREYFFMKMEHYQKFYPSLMKELEENVFDSFRDFEERIISMMPYNMQEFDEHYIKWNSEKAINVEEDIPPSESSAS
jgi:hypothetical protein